MKKQSNTKKIAKQILDTKKLLKKPIVLRIIVLIYFFSPFVHFMSYKFMGDLSFVSTDFIQYNTFFGFPVVLTMPIIAVGLFFTNLYSWYIFLLHSILVFIDNTYRAFLMPSSSSSSFLFIAGSVGLFFMILYLIQKDVRAPYLHLLPRGWRKDFRHEVDLEILIEKTTFRISDLSISGCFIKMTEEKMPKNTTWNYFAEIDGVTFQGKVKPMRKTEAGFGVKFLELKEENRMFIKNYLKKLK